MVHAITDFVISRWKSKTKSSPEKGTSVHVTGDTLIVTLTILRTLGSKEPPFDIVAVYASATILFARGRRAADEYANQNLS